MIEAEFDRPKLQELAFRVGARVRVSARAARIFPAPSAGGHVTSMPSESEPFRPALAS